jgi:hypothetical protein
MAVPIEWSFDQGVELRESSPDVRSGVGMVMSYYMAKRMLAQIETTPDVLRRKMPLFASMQRAAKWNVTLSSIEWVKMLVHGDNLDAKVGHYVASLEEALSQAGGQMGSFKGDAIAAYMSMRWQGHGHGVVFVGQREAAD